MITQIGITAGAIWEVLDASKALDMDVLCERLPDPPEMILMSLGWLVREGHVGLKSNDDTYSVYLRDQKFESDGSNRGA